MKYLVSWSWEMDGHAGASAIVCEKRDQIKQLIDKMLHDEDGNEIGHVKSNRLTDTGYEYYGEWDCGEFAITIQKFKNYSDMVGKEVFSRTG